MNRPPSEADARFDRAVDRWFHDQLSMHPETATFLGVHDRDAELSAGGRDAVDADVAFYQRTITEFASIDPGELSNERVLDRDLALHQARLNHFWLTEYRPWAGSSEAAERIGEALFPLFTRDFAPLPDRLATSPAGSRRRRASCGKRASSHRTDPPVGRDRPRVDRAAARLPRRHPRCGCSESRDWPLAPGSKQRQQRRSRPWSSTQPGSGKQVLPRAAGEWKAGPERFEEMLRLRELGADGDEILAVGEELLDAEKTAATTSVTDRAGRFAGRGHGRGQERPRRHVRRVAGRVPDEHGRRTRVRPRPGACDAARRGPSHVIETPGFLRHLIPFAAYYDPPRFDPCRSARTSSHPLGTPA